MGGPERLSASVASKHLACHASANLELAIPGYDLSVLPTDTKASSRGTELHHVMELIGGYTPREMLLIAEATQYIATLRQRRRFKMLREEASTGWWLASPPRTTADVVLYVGDEMHVVDYKWGSIPVEAAGNSQGMYYSCAYLPLAPKVKEVHFHVVQPMIGRYDETVFSRAELEQFMVDTKAAEAAIAAGDTTFGPSDSCTFCPANPHGRGAKAGPYCPAMMALLYPPQTPDAAMLAAADED